MGHTARPDRDAGLSAPERERILSSFRAVATPDAWARLGQLCDTTIGHVQPAGPVVISAAQALAEYRSHLDASKFTGQYHPGLADLVGALERCPPTSAVHIEQVLAGEGVAVLVSEEGGAPLGLVTLPRRIS